MQISILMRIFCAQNVIKSDTNHPATQYHVSIASWHYCSPLWITRYRVQELHMLTANVAKDYGKVKISSLMFSLVLLNLHMLNANCCKGLWEG